MLVISSVDAVRKSD